MIVYAFEHRHEYGSDLMGLYRDLEDAKSAVEVYLRSMSTYKEVRWKDLGGGSFSYEHQNFSLNIFPVEVQ